MRGWERVVAGVLLGLGVLLGVAAVAAGQAGVAARSGALAPEAGWPEYGGTGAGQRYSAARQITRENVSRLRPVWSVPVRNFEGEKPRGSFEATPVLWQGTLYFDTPRDVVMAVDAATGKVRWTFDPKLDDAKLKYIVTSRGVVLWHDAATARAAAMGHDAAGGQASAAGHDAAAASRKAAECADRVFVATLDRRLMALDARDGKPCAGFGREGAVDLATGIYISNPDLLEYTSAAVVVGDRVVLGSSVGDNQTTDAPSGAVRGFDARTGRPVWTWEPVRWVAGERPPHTSGAGNAWAPLAADPEHDLVFVPTGSAAVDYYGGTRVGDNRDADSIVALRASTGEKVWGFQLVHHNLWDYDTASQPLLFEWHGSGRGAVPAVAVTNKTGMIYVFNRLTGEPLFPIEERKVPQTTVPGEVTWPTQPISTVQPLLPMRFSADQMPTQDAEDERFCRRLIAQVRYDGPFTPPSLGGTIVYPAALGGPNWGSSALDVETGVMYTRVSSMPFLIWLTGAEDGSSLKSRWQAAAPMWMGGKARLERERLRAAAFRPPDADLGGGPMPGTPYAVYLRALVGLHGVPCGGAPYGRLVATSLNTGKQVWSVAHGVGRTGRPGSVGMSGPVVTAGGLVFVAASQDPYLRAYDARNGKELWKGRLPAPGTGTPMTYVVNGRQYVVVAAGGGDAGGDTLVGFGFEGCAAPRRW